MLNGLPKRFETIITALDAIGDDDPSFTFDKVRSRLLQEEKRSAMRSTSVSIPETSALITRSNEETGKTNQKLCSHCGKKKHTEPYCWAKYGRPTRRGGGQVGGTTRTVRIRTRGTACAGSCCRSLLRRANDDCDTDYVCLMANCETPSSGKGSRREHSLWYIDSGATSHMTFDRASFVTYEEITQYPVEMGDMSTSEVIGRGDVRLTLLNNGVPTPAKLRDVLHVPSFAYSLVSVSSSAESCWKLQE